MNNRGCTPIEIVSLLHFRDYDFIVKCLELIRLHIADFAPECQRWGIQIIALCHHHPDNIYPAFGVIDAGAADFDEIERFGQRAEEWVRKQPLGWLLDASTRIDVTKWNVLVEMGRPRSNADGRG